MVESRLLHRLKPGREGARYCGGFLVLTDRVFYTRSAIIYHSESVSSFFEGLRIYAITIAVSETMRMAGRVVN